METVEIQTVETTYIPTKEEAEREIRYLFYKLILCPESFTLLDLCDLYKYLENEGYL